MVPKVVKSALLIGCLKEYFVPADALFFCLNVVKDKVREIP